MTPAILSTMPSQATHGPGRNMQRREAWRQRGPGELNWDRARRPSDHEHARLTTANTHSSRNAVVGGVQRRCRCWGARRRTRSGGPMAGSTSDSGAGRRPTQPDLAQRPRQPVLLGHAVDQPARHQHIDQGGVRDREKGEEREHLVDREVGRPFADHLDQGRPLGLVDISSSPRSVRRRPRPRPGCRGSPRYRGRAAWCGGSSARAPGLLDHVDRVLEADHREERDRGRRGHGEEAGPCPR